MDDPDGFVAGAHCHRQISNMRKIYGFACLLCYCSMLQAQGINERLRLASDKLLADSQLKHGILGLCVVKSETGEKIFEVNAQTGLAPASCQKTITSAAAMEILGPSYRYQTVLGYTGTIGRGSLNGDLILIGSGDPSLGSWRYDSTKEAKVLGSWMSALQQQGIRKITGNLVGYNGKWETETLPGGWI